VLDSETGGWRAYSSLRKDEESYAQVQRLIEQWERLRWEDELQRQR